MADKEQDKAVKGTLRQLLDIIKSDLSMENITRFWTESRADAIVSLFLVLGLIFMPFNEVWGGAIIGFIGGLYLFNEIYGLLAGLLGAYESLGRFKFYIMLALLVGVVLYALTMAVSLVIGMIVGDYVKNKLDE